MSGNLLEVRDLSVDFVTPSGPVHALRHVDLDVPKGRILGIVGESGSGKSTVIWAITRLLAQNAEVKGGSIRFGEKDVLGLPQQALDRFRSEDVSVVFQDPMTSQIPVLTYARQMADIQYRRGDRTMGQKRETAVKLLRTVGIPDPERRILDFPHQFSGGMRQRAGIAMALLTDPALLIADEPTTALDVTMEAQIALLLQRLQAELDATVVLVSHNLGLVAELCDEVVVLYAGEVVERGDIGTIFEAPGHPYTRALLDCDPARVLAKTRRLPVIPGEVPDLRRAPVGCIFAPRCPIVMEVCRTVRPPDVSLADGHVARCHAAAPTAPAGTRAAPVEPVRHAAGEPVLDAQVVHVRFRLPGAWRARLAGREPPSLDAVAGVSLALKAGETVGIVGESGSGKTSLGRALMGLVRSSSRSIRLLGQEVSGLDEAGWRGMRREVAMMFQDPVGSLSPRLSVRSLLVEPFVVHGGATQALDREAERLIDLVALPRDLLDRYPHELSGGQARRVGVARALALRPKLVIADEPTAGLDVSVQGEILNLLHDLQREHGLSYLVITHNLPVVRHIADRIGIMYLGRLVEQGDADAVFAAPAHPYTRSLVEGVPRPDPKRRRQLRSIEGEVPSLLRRPQGCEFHPRCPIAQDRCRSEAPQPRPLRDGRSVCCHFPLAA
ncbi:MAG: ABC transporter ATP-binding protein [Geminicoccaceae bacterium]